MSITKTTATAAFLAASSLPALADNGFTAGLSFEQSPNTYKFTIPTRYFADDSSADYLPSHVSFGVHSSNCLSANAGYGWTGGNTNVGGFSWSGSTAVKASYCNSMLSVNVRPIADHVLHEIDTALRDTIRTEMDNVTPAQLHVIAAQHGINLNQLMDTSTNFLADYIQDLSQPVPTENDISDAFATYWPPTISNPRLTAIHDATLSFATETVREVHELRDTLSFIHGLPDNVQGEGEMLSFGITASVEGRYHFARKAFAFAGLDINAVAKASFHGKPFAEIADTPNIIIPFYGYEGVARIGIGAQDVLGDFDIAASYNYPFSQFWVPVVEDATLENTTLPYFSVTATHDDNFNVGVSYVPEQKQYGVNFGFQF